MRGEQVGKAGAACVDVTVKRVQGNVRQGGKDDGFFLPPGEPAPCVSETA